MQLTVDHPNGRKNLAAKMTGCPVFALMPRAEGAAVVLKS